MLIGIIGTGMFLVDLGCHIAQQFCALKHFIQIQRLLNLEEGYIYISFYWFWMSGTRDLLLFGFSASSPQALGKFTRKHNRPQASAEASSPPEVFNLEDNIMTKWIYHHLQVPQGA